MTLPAILLAVLVVAPLLLLVADIAFLRRARERSASHDVSLGGLTTVGYGLHIAPMPFVPRPVAVRTERELVAADLRSTCPDCGSDVYYASTRCRNCGVGLQWEELPSQGADRIAA